MAKSVYVLFVFTVLSVFVLSGCDATHTPTQNPGVGNTPSPDINTPSVSLSANFSELTASQDIKKFNSVEELQNFLAERALSSTANDVGGGIRSFGAMEKTVASDSVEAPMAAGANSGASGATDYSHTNIQVQGVDEADFVKNDDRYIYMISGNNLIIVDALDAKNAAILSTTKFNDQGEYATQLRPTDLFIYKNKLVLFVDGNEKGYYFQKYDIKPQQTYKQKTFIYIYDITDKKSPKVEERFSVSGGYYSSRMINDVVYLVSTDPVQNYVYIDQPFIKSEINVKTVTPDIYYFDNPDDNYQFNTVTSISLADNSVVDAKTFMLGYSNTLMVSENNIYIAYQKHTYWCWGWWRCSNNNDDEKTRFYDVVVPLLQGDIKTDINSVISQDLTEDEKWSKISDKLSEFYGRLENDESLQNQYTPMFDKIQAALDEYDAKKALENQKTVIQKIGISDGKIDYQAKAEVDGTLLNQYSMDEYNNNLRVATTVSTWFSSGRLNYNNVYVLDDNMKQIGSLQNIAENESIYSTRFMGDKLYMVTFQRIDPFFVIDLSRPTDPKVLGELKIPGYSQYLHPYNENFVIGVGKDVGQNQWGGLSPKGVRVSLFDVTDVNNPKEVDHYDIGEAGSDSPVLYDPKAFLFSSTKGFIVLPVSEITQKTPINQYNFHTTVWHGAYVLGVTEQGFSLLGKVKHSSMTTDYYNWWDQASVTRSLYMDNNLYTISQKYIKINDLGSSDLKSLNSIDLPYTNQGPIYYANQGVAVSAPIIE